MKQPSVPLWNNGEPQISGGTNPYPDEDDRDTLDRIVSSPQYQGAPHDLNHISQRPPDRQAPTVPEDIGEPNPGNYQRPNSFDDAFESEDTERDHSRQTTPVRFYRDPAVPFDQKSRDSRDYSEPNSPSTLTVARQRPQEPTLPRESTYSAHFRDSESFKGYDESSPFKSLPRSGRDQETSDGTDIGYPIDFEPSRTVPNTQTPARLQGASTAELSPYEPQLLPSEDEEDCDYPHPVLAAREFWLSDFPAQLEAAKAAEDEALTDIFRKLCNLEPSEAAVSAHLERNRARAAAVTERTGRPWYTPYDRPPHSRQTPQHFEEVVA